MKRFFTLFIIVAILITSLAGCKKEEAFLDIEGTKISIDEAKFFVFSMESQIGSEAMSQQSPYSDGTLGDYIKEQALDTVITINLSTHIAKEKGITLTDEELSLAKDNAKGYLEAVGAEEIKKNGFTLETIENIIIKYNYLDKLIEVITDDSEIDQEKLEQDLEMYSLQNPIYALTVNEGAEEAAKSVRAKHILIKTIDDTGASLPEEEIEAAKAKAEDILAKVKAGEDFVTLVHEYSQDEASLATDGEMTFTRGQMVPEFEEASFSLNVGEISDLVKTDYGYHIIKVEETNIPGTEESIAQLNELVENILMQAKRAQKEVIFQEKLEDWKNEYSITVNEEIWDAYEVTGQTPKGSEGNEDPTNGTPEENPEDNPEDNIEE